MMPIQQQTSGAGERVALVTNVKEYAGPGAMAALADAGYTVVCHDLSFTEAAAREEFAGEDGRLRIVAEQNPHDLVGAILSELGRIDVVVSNDFIPGTLFEPEPELPEPGTPYMRKQQFEDVDADEFRATLEDLVVRPFLLSKAVLPSMKERRSGAIIFITSAVSYRAGPQYEMYSAGRSATTSLAQGLAIQAGPFNIQVNPIGPAWFENPTYYPERHRDLFMPDVERDVPLGRLGRQDEMGALIVFLVSGQAAPLTGQFIPFTAGTRLRR
jgi:3-oxoacyl-[acyl-carrier protein] reductase